MPRMRKRPGHRCVSGRLPASSPATGAAVPGQPAGSGDAAQDTHRLSRLIGMDVVLASGRVVDVRVTVPADTHDHGDLRVQGLLVAGPSGHRWLRTRVWPAKRARAAFTWWEDVSEVDWAAREIRLSTDDLATAPRP